MRSRAVEERSTSTGGAPARTLAFSPKAKRALEAGRREADALGSKNIGTSHLLLGVIAARDGLSAEILDRANASSARAQEMLREPVPAGYFPPYYPRERRLWPLYGLASAAAAFGFGIFVGWMIWG